MFVGHDNGWTVTEVANELGVSKSVISRLMATLAAEGFLVLRSDTRRYFIGPVAFEVGTRFGAANLGSSLQPILQDLSERTNATAQLGTLQGAFVSFLAVSVGGGMLRVVASPGERRYVHISAIGKALLAALPETERRRIVNSMLVGGLLPASAPETIRDPEAFLRHLEATRERGYSLSTGETETTISGIGMVIATNVTGFPLGLSLSYPSTRFSVEDHPRLVKELEDASTAARRIWSDTVS
ncbi:IclR family transcriptional regulator [Microbacterium soli]|uniref:IclR family transcriptional regulator n=2 Tax=Microbacterium soli TaxID=446075 RepID=A0ABP7NE19_9MICO